MSIDFLNILTGTIMITSGRKFFWLFVGCIGFAIGLQYVPFYWDVSSQTLLIVFSIITGIIGALLAVLFQKLAIGLAGFIGGGYIAIYLLDILGLDMEKYFFLPYIVGGTIGAMLLFFIFDWALIIVSSFTGAMLIVQTVNLDQDIELWLLIALFAFGILIQTFLFLRARSASKRPKAVSKNYHSE